MNGLFLILSLSVCGMFHSAMAQYRSEVWVSDEGNGMYRNPVLHADYSDPDVCVVGEDCFLTASSFNCTPGLPILHSKDLVNWKIVNYALKKVEPVEYYNEARHGKGVWAPSIRFHEGMYYIYWGNPDFGIFMVKTRDPYGEWDKPVLVKAGKGMIDPCPLWDDDGRVYLAHAWAGSRAKFNSVLTVCELNKEGTKVISDPVLVFDGNDGVNHTIEGAKFYKRNGFYYLFAPAGGVVSGWQLVMRSKNVYGPYEPRIVMAQGKTDINGPHQGGWVDTPAGESWFLHFQDKGAYGRVLHLNPMKWVNDWPVIGVDRDGDGCGDPVSRYRKPKTDTLTGNCIKKCTHQGYADESMWARGQAWAIYGYTVVFRETGDPKYLEFAEKLVDVYLKNLPEDYVPYWDFNAPDIPNAPRDASAACVVASALLEMSGFYGNGQGEKYKEAAEKMLCSLSSDKYQSRDTNVAFLLHSTGHWPAKSEIDASIIYADYYYIEALLRLKRINEGLRAVE